ncbi:MAG: hypothetical protein GC203_15770 [Phenylobacterium sp.]|uniref:PEPxxWA-CTERM sorting domain-containing protein n=1 Tax=Phenylobacterium sp. TaxID=1871053 RepID=UPI0025E26F9B|nr:PEPxxWA-CTERM sorting domain-containing protein [Phenylobacterium sp.]MBI1199318.1 hypothetical protein [Phenylobacterium sp.]
MKWDLAVRTARAPGAPRRSATLAWLWPSAIADEVFGPGASRRRDDHGRMFPRGGLAFMLVAAAAVAAPVLTRVASDELAGLRLNLFHTQDAASDSAAAGEAERGGTGAGGAPGGGSSGGAGAPNDGGAPPVRVGAPSAEGKGPGDGAGLLDQGGTDASASPGGPAPDPAPGQGVAFLDAGGDEGQGLIGGAAGFGGGGGGAGSGSGGGGLVGGGTPSPVAPPGPDLPAGGPTANPPGRPTLIDLGGGLGVPGTGDGPGGVFDPAPTGRRGEPGPVRSADVFPDSPGLPPETGPTGPSSDIPPPDEPANIVARGAVPEPSAWIVMVSGFAAVGAALRRRGRHTPILR